MHNFNTKLMAHLRFFREEGKGVTPFVFGSDVRPGMLEDEANFVDGTHKFRLSERYKKLAEGQALINDAFDMLTGDTIKNLNLLQHKLERLKNPDQVARLLQLVAEYKVMVERDAGTVDVTGSVKAALQIEEELRQ